MKKEQEYYLRQDKNFLIIYSALFISGVGDGINKIALLWVSYNLKNSAAAVGIVLTCLTLPGTFSGLLSGALADRHSKREIIVSARIVLSIIALGFVPYYKYQNMLLFFLLSFLQGTVFQFEGGPYRAYLPEIFPKNRLSRVNAAALSARNLAMVTGYVLATVIIAAGNVAIAFIAEAAAFFISAIMFRLLPATLPRIQEGSLNIKIILSDIKIGASYIVRSPSYRFLILSFISLFGISCFATPLILPLCKNILSASNNSESIKAFGIIQTATGLGGFISCFFIPFLIKKYGCLRTLVSGAFLCAVGLLAFGYIPNIFFLAVITAITAASAPMLLVPLLTFVQRKTETRFMGRVMGAMDTTILFAMSLCFFLGGIVGDILDAKKVFIIFIITGFAIIGAALIILFLPGYKRVRQAERKIR